MLSGEISLHSIVYTVGEKGQDKEIQGNSTGALELRLQLRITERGL